MSEEPESLDFPDAAPVTLEAALAAVAGWREVPGRAPWGLHQIAIALADEVARRDADAAVALAALAALAARIVALEADLADLQRTFDLRWDADMRAVKRWRAGHPERDLIFPDRADLVVWLLEREGSSVIDDASPQGATVPGEGA